MPAYNVYSCIIDSISYVAIIIDLFEDFVNHTYIRMRKVKVVTLTRIYVYRRGKTNDYVYGY